MTQPDLKDVAQDGIDITNDLASMLGQDPLEGVGDAIGSSDTPPADTAPVATPEPVPATPEPAPEPTPAPEPAPSVDYEKLLQENARLKEVEQKSSQDRQQAEQRQVVHQQWQTVQQEVQQWEAYYRNLGHDEQVYKPLLDAFQKNKADQLRTEYAANQYGAELNRKALLATELHIKTGTPIAELWAYNDTESMTRASEQGSELNTLKKQLAAQQKQISDIKVPPQSFESGNGSGVGGIEDKAFIAQFENPAFEATEEDWKRLDAIQQKLS